MLSQRFEAVDATAYEPIRWLNATGTAHPSLVGLVPAEAGHSLNVVKVWARQGIVR
jgi:hypothetical protein